MKQTYCILVPSAGRRQAHVPAHASDAPAHHPRTSDEIESPGQAADRGLNSRPPFVPGTDSFLTALPTPCRQSFTSLDVHGGCAAALTAQSRRARDWRLLAVHQDTAT